MIVELLGTGTSHGVPRIGCSCPTCTSQDPRDNRMRSSIWLQTADTSVVIDTGPEFRIQALRAGIRELDAVFYTHNHADHLNGIDDLRVFTEVRPLDIYGPEQVLKDIKGRFPYAVTSRVQFSSLPRLQLRSLPSEGVTVGSLHFIPIPLIHGCREVYGYRVGRFAYLTDCKTIPAASLAQLQGVEIVVLDALRHETHPTHMNVQEAIATARSIGAKMTYFTHMTHRISHAALLASLPDGFEPAYDGLRFTLEESSG